MPKIKLVTDSCAHFTSSQILQQFNITVVPNRVYIGGQTYLEGVDIDAAAALRLVEKHPETLRVTAPRKADFAAVYKQLSWDCDAIISIHPSRKLYQNWHNAQQAAEEMMGACEIIVLDSRSVSAGMAMLLEVAGRCIQAGLPLDEIVRQVRGAIDRTYGVYHVETLFFLEQNHIMTGSHSILGTMLGVKPFLTIEDGLFIPIEKVQTRTQTIDRLVDFASEFTDLEKAVILQSTEKALDQTRILQERLRSEFPQHEFPYVTYGPSLAAQIGPSAMGLVILESELDEIGNAF